MAEFFEGCNDMVALVTLLETLVAKGWLEGLSLIMDIAIHNTSPNGQDAASRALATLCRDPDIQTKLLAEIDIKLQLAEWDMGLPTIGGQPSAALGWRKLFILLSRNIGMRALCSVMLTRIEDMCSPGKLVLQAVAEPDMEAALLRYRTDMAAYARHSHPELRRAAAELLGNVATELRARDLIDMLFELALTDTDDKIRLFCMEHLTHLGSDVKAHPLFVEWMVPSNYSRLECVTDARWRLQLSRLYEALHIPGALLRLSVGDEDQDVREAAMTSLGRVVAETRDWLGVLIDHLKRCLDVATSDSNSNVRAAWASMFTSVSFIEPNWSDGLQVLANLALEDENRKVRLAAYHGLDTLILKSKRHGGLAPSLTKAFEACLKKSSHKPVLDDFHPVYPYAVPFNVVACFISPLVSYVVERADDDPSVTREEGALMHIAKEGELGHQAALLTNLVENLASRIPGTRCGEFARKLATRIHSRQHPLYPKIPYRPLVQRLVHPSREARSTSLALLAIFYWDCAIAADTLPLLHPLINIILDDSDTALSFYAARLLHNLCRNETSATQLLSLEPDYVPRLMVLLRRENPLSLAVARLIAAISYHSGDINGQILRWIAAELTSERFVEAELGILQLLSELIASRYLNSKVTTDYILLLIASALASRGSPTSDKFRPQLQAYMWLYYRDQIPATDSEVMAELVKVFQFTAFGNHGTEAEADAWLSMAKYLGGPTQP
ncbi:armadillo-type protein [Coprinopsis sp. MPI-PUGE-AT-0042]|nr:armadillo-type protein [Coprinopsis sp. MPI-PUGE-AT-0042]